MAGKTANTECLFSHLPMLFLIRDAAYTQVLSQRAKLCRLHECKCSILIAEQLEPLSQQSGV